MIIKSFSLSSAYALVFSEQSEPEERCVSFSPKGYPYAHEVVCHRTP